MNYKIENYQRFFEDQIREHEQEYRTYQNTPLNQLFQEDKAFFGNIVGVNDSTGHIILKIRKNRTPRLKMQKTFCVLRKAVWEEFGTSISQWKCLCKDFLEGNTYHTLFSDIKPLYFLKNSDAEYDYLGCGAVQMDLYNSIKKALDDHKVLWFVMFEGFPPVKMLLNLRDYISNNQEDQDLLIEPKISYEQWRPQEVTCNDDIPSLVISSLQETGECVLQGPPGTGKSYAIAQIIKRYMDEGKKVCVTSMSNKGLIELIDKEPLNEHRLAGKISKTLLTADESNAVPGTLFADKYLSVTDGCTICTTNYILSDKIKETVKKVAQPIYDLLVIEEASQTYLTSIIAFKTLAKECLIVGDPMQLPPIVLCEDKADYLEWNVPVQSNGLMTYALGTDVKSYRITTSFRLTPKSVGLTGLFYDNSLSSVQKETVEFPLCKNSHFFPTGGGTLLYHVEGAIDSICSKNALNTMKNIVSEIEENYPNRSIAIISPFRETVQKIQKEFYYEHQKLDITVETIDRIQGMTVDYAIIYYPLRNISFAMSENRFNVATSRSRSTTLIISDIPLEGMNSISGKVSEYLKACDSIISQCGEQLICKTQFPIEARVMEIKADIESIKTDSCATLPGIKVVGHIDLSKFEKKKKEIQLDKQNLYVIDTNVFVNEPDIISKIDKKYPIILSAKVIDELDHLKIKLDSDGKRHVQAALKNINYEMDKRDVRMEQSDLSLLPPDFDKRSPDNNILTVALKYKSDNPIILTSDNGLQVKAKGLKLTTISLKEFLRQLR